MSTTAIIIFADAPKKAARQKILLKDPQRNLDLFTQLNRDILSTAKNTGLTYFIFNETTPGGDITGAHIADAMASVYTMGYDQVIIVWNNCMGLDHTTMRKAMHELQYAPLVVGPAHWGGVYLVGISQSIYSRLSFAELNWGSNLLAHDLSCYHQGRVILPALRVLNGTYSMRIITVIHFFETIAARFPLLSMVKTAWAKLRAVPAKLRHTQGAVKLPAETAK